MSVNHGPTLRFSLPLFSYYHVRLVSAASTWNAAAREELHCCFPLAASDSGASAMDALSSTLRYVGRVHRVGVAFDIKLLTLDFLTLPYC